MGPHRQKKYQENTLWAIYLFPPVQHNQTETKKESKKTYIPGVQSLMTKLKKGKWHCKSISVNGYGT